MSVFRPDPEAGQQPTASDPPAFQLVRPGYDPAQVDASLRQLVVRPEDAEQAGAALRREVTSLQRQHPTFEFLVEQAALLAESSRSVSSATACWRNWVGCMATSVRWRRRAPSGTRVSCRLRPGTKLAGPGRQDGPLAGQPSRHLAGSKVERVARPYFSVEREARRRSPGGVLDWADTVDWTPTGEALDCLPEPCSAVQPGRPPARPE